jgi:cell fate regulator YaaT (PSP1 superfamily)
MLIAQIQFTPWDKIYFFSTSNLDLKVGDKVAVKTDLGVELGDIVNIGEMTEKEIIEKFQKYSSDNMSEDEAEGGNSEKKEIKGEIKIDEIIKPVLRIATASDLGKTPKESEKRKALEFCKKLKEKLNLPMKFVDVHFSFDGSRITFAFIADGRVDFREMVKELTRHFGRTIRLQQIGIRDESKIMGDFGHCGKPLCCRNFLKEFTSITSEMSELQQCSHRGSERISGICGRLMCCLSYEQKGYEDLLIKLPPIGAKVNVDGKKGVVIGHHILKQSVDVSFPGENNEDHTIIEVDINRHKKKKKFNIFSKKQLI